MKWDNFREHSRARRACAGSIAGMVAAAAYAVELEIDRRLIRNNADDLLLLGRLLTANRRLARPIGLGIHLANGAVLGALYGALCHDRLPGPGWLRGTVFANIENVGLYPLALLEDLHPAIRSGELDRYWTWPAFLQSIPRHVVFGIVLGPLTDRLLTTR